ncbi:MAG: amidohydrolase family protein, partial [Caulobacterales bacterium]|nr:amidohydrolase family protein [Caulobacterales bacterium]
LLQSKVFEDFPNLKIIIAHGGGAVPYQMGRFRAWTTRVGDPVSFDEKMRKLKFDTCNYSKEALEFLIKVVGKDNVLFGTEKPGTGSAKDISTGRDFDDLKPIIESIDWLSDEDKRDIFECNCKKLFTRAFEDFTCEKL